MTTQRTIIDILRKGNQELFHSSVIAWFLDPKGEHGYGSQFLEGFAELLGDRGSSDMKVALQGAALSSVTTEATTYKGRYDIVLKIGQLKVIIENKTKSLGALPQFDQYKGQGIVLVALGLDDVSFDRQVRKDFPVVTYRNILDLLDSLGEPAANDFGVLARHYREYLRRELGLLEQLNSWAISGAEEIATKITSTVAANAGATQNDRRFLNLYHVERFRDFLLGLPKWKGCHWATEKNMRSGVWLAFFDPAKPPSPFHFNDVICDFCTQNAAGIWFHVELWEGVLAAADDAVAGTIQVKCHSSQSNKKVMEEFRSMWKLQDDEECASLVQDKWDTFYLMGRLLRRRHLPHKHLEAQIESFMCRFGSFATC